MSEQRKTTYDGGFHGLIQQMEGRRAPITYAEGEALPALDVDLAPLKTHLMAGAAPELGDSRSGYARKYRALAEEFDGEPTLLHLHGLLIANLRRRGQPDHCAALFQRLWAEEAAFLMAHLDARWLVSAITTFGDHGMTEVQRSVGHALSVLFGMMKLYETERLFSGATPEQPHSWKKRSAKHLAMQMDAYAVGGAGGLDVNMLGRLWQEGSGDPVMAPLVQRLLNLLIEDDKTVFRRLQTMRSRRQKQVAAAEAEKGKVAEKRAEKPLAPAASRLVQDPAQLSWATVTLAKAPLPEILQFVAHHLSLGAAEVHIYLDAPDPATVAALELHPQVQVTTCDDAYWAGQKKPRMKSQEMRQIWVATQTYAQTSCHWLAHVDVDEFLLPPEGRSVAEVLAAAPDELFGFRMHSAELMASEEDGVFKLNNRAVGKRHTVIEEIYPTFGQHVKGGFLSHVEGKVIVRTGTDGVRLGIHAALHGGARVKNVTFADGLFVGHAHAPSWEVFRTHMQQRIDRGSYRRRDAEETQVLGELIAYLQEHEGEAGLRMMYDEIALDTPERRAGLQAQGMLLLHPLRLDQKVAEVFGPLLPELPDGLEGTS